MAEQSVTFLLHLLDRSVRKTNTMLKIYKTSQEDLMTRYSQNTMIEFEGDSTVLGKTARDTNVLLLKCATLKVSEEGQMDK